MGHGIRHEVIIDFVLCDIEQLILVNAQRLSCASLHRLSEVECNTDCVSGSGSPRLKLLEVESEMHRVNVVGWKSVIVPKVFKIKKG